MIVRQTPEGFLLIEQHEHGLISGAFARNLAVEFTDGPLSKDVLEAIAEHDRAWEEPDCRVLWNEEAGRPYSFLDHPPEPKTTAYARFLDEMEDRNPYTALLCSAHYGSLVASSDDPYERHFAAHEEDRRARIRAGLTADDLADFDRDFAALQLTDDLSLFVCLNEPGENEHPWFRDGLRFRDTTLAPIWCDSETLTFDPYPFRGDFVVEVPYRIFGRDGVESRLGAYHVRLSPQN